VRFIEQAKMSGMNKEKGCIYGQLPVNTTRRHSNANHSSLFTDTTSTFEHSLLLTGMKR
jgi:hypothetical protein